MEGRKPLFFLLPQLLQWPDTLLKSGLLEAPLSGWKRDQISALIRVGHPELAEPLLYSRLARHDEEHFFVLIHLAICADITGESKKFHLLLEQLVQQYPHQDLTRWLQIKHWISNLDEESILKAGPSVWKNEENSPFLLLMRCRYELASSNLKNAQDCLNALPSWLSDTVEAAQCRGDLAYVQGNKFNALEIWMKVLSRVPRCMKTLQRAMDLAIECRYSEGIVASLRRGLEEFGEHPGILGLIGSIKLYQREPGRAQRSILLGKSWQSIGKGSIFLSNQITAYEMNGVADWVDYLYVDAVHSYLNNQSLHSNLCLQLASIESPQYGNHLKTYLDSLRKVPESANYRHAGPIPYLSHTQSSCKPLTISWITGDLAPHPVSRFLLQYFYASSGSLKHRHLLVSTFDHGQESCKEWFEGLGSLEIIDVSAYQNENKVTAVRELNADIALDLSGWTSYHFLAGFMARLAPIQVNYLGYFASSGLSEMDYWLGDSGLFPSSVTEYHTESIYRLPRPFLAWQPCSPLPESQAQIDCGPIGSVRFGSFNHNRKLSDKTLRLWARILSKIPHSKLVLKANSADDIYTQSILRRRMLRQGLNPEMVEWLNLTKSPLEHLEQYRFLDIALDPVPNGGCTTSCESLWMGVPVISLKGKSYVSRMSTAVLGGAGLQEWIAVSEDDYVRLAVQAAQQVHWLRSNRSYWRNSVQTSALGDAQDLMINLEDAFGKMVQDQLSITEFASK